MPPQAHCTISILTHLKSSSFLYHYDKLITSGLCSCQEQLIFVERLLFFFLLGVRFTFPFRWHFVSLVIVFMLDSQGVPPSLCLNSPCYSHVSHQLPSHHSACVRTLLSIPHPLPVHCHILDLFTLIKLIYMYKTRNKNNFFSIRVVHLHFEQTKSCIRVLAL